MLDTATPAPDLSRRAVGFARDLAAHGDAPAVVTGDARLTYVELARRVDDVAARLGTGRRLVMVPAGNDLDSLVAYLAALAAGHPVLLVPGGHDAAVASLTAAYDPDVVVRGASVEHRREGSGHDLHPDLALLLSTSGSTGSPKLVRLSHENLESNAASIAEYLGIRTSDRAATTLPIHYCYGLSVVNGHLLRGATLLLTDLSVVDPCFWERFRNEGGTTFAGVPHTFELLDRVGFDDMDLPHLRYVTQAGGRLAPARVEHYARLGARRGWDLFVMYGQTEATARMAYLPPALAAEHPAAVGVPVPGGSLTLRSVDGDDPGVGELVYSGPNVMLGYAQSPADLSLGRVVTELATGDLARRNQAGLVEIVGRRSAFVKVLGARIDLQRVDDVLAQVGLEACCTGDDDHLVVAVAGPVEPSVVRALVTSEAGVPAHAVTVCPVDQIPRLVTGKPDLRAVADLASAARAARAATDPARTSPVEGPVDASALRRLYAELLGRDDVGDDDSFVGLGGDSLSYVEMSVRLEDLLGTLPRDWHVRPLATLVPNTPPPARRWLRSLETSVALRALAIVLVVATHSGLLDVKGSAHVLVAIAGFNFARFQLSESPRAARVRHQLRSIARIAVPSMVWIGGAYMLTDRYGPENVVLLNALLGPERWSTQWDYWFVEVVVLTLVVLAAVLAVPWVDRAQRRAPFAFVAAMVAVGLVWRFELTPVDLLHTKPVFWLFALGWACAAATRLWQRVAVTGVALLATPGFFDDPWRDALILAGVVALAWLPSVPSPAWASRVAGVLASASLYIYVTHWQVHVYIEDYSPLLAVVASLAVGIAYWQLVQRVSARLSASSAVRRRTPAHSGRSRPEGRRRARGSARWTADRSDPSGLTENSAGAVACADARRVRTRKGRDGVDREHGVGEHAAAVVRRGVEDAAGQEIRVGGRRTHRSGVAPGEAADPWPRVSTSRQAYPARVHRGTWWASPRPPP